MTEKQEQPVVWYYVGMIIRFHNLGKIKETELDLRPLTVIIGPNNSNKTYVVYSVYGLWQAERDESTHFNDIVANALGKSKSNTIQIPVDDALRKELQTHSNRMCKRFKDDLENFYQDSSGKLFSNTHFHLEVSLDDLLAALPRLREQTHHISGWEFNVKAGESTIEIKYRRLSKPSELDGVSSDTLIVTLLLWVRVMLSMTTQGLMFPEPFLLPAERNAFVIAYKLLGNRRYKLLRESQRGAFSSRISALHQIDLLREAGEVRYPQPVEDFLDFLTDVETEKSNGVGRETPERKSFFHLADIIENSIQNSNKTRYRPTALGGKEIITQVEKGLDIDLYNASSSIKQLAPLLLYLRYRARENDLLIIDEPEMNLHPESQAKLLEVLAMLVNHGVNVLLTTHSPYILAHLNNLAQDNETSQAVKKRQAQSLYLKNPESLLRMDQVSAYEMRDNQLHSLKDPDYGIRWDTLSDVSVELQQKYFEIYEKGHAKEKVKTTRKAAKTSSGQTGTD